MKIPAIKAKIGANTFYITTLSFQEVNDKVGRVENEIYDSQALSDLLQRPLTDNYISIKNYILNQNDRFFNSIVLAVYDEYPDWREIEFIYQDLETYSMGILEFTDKHKIFPIDGQHRVEGIKAAIKENPNLKDERIGAIFIGHINSVEGKTKTRRLFTTLNRYARPVTLDDIIALDEDDIVAINTRELIEGHKLFCGKRVVLTKNKSIPSTNKDAITSIIALYQANLDLYLAHYKSKHHIKLSGKKLIEKRKYRPAEKEISEYKKYLFTFWDDFADSFDVIKDYLKLNNNPSDQFRNSEQGGNLIFRPVSFNPLIQAIIRIAQETEDQYASIMAKMNKINLDIDSLPWKKILWDPIGKKMIMNNQKLVYYMLIDGVRPELLSEKERTNMVNRYFSLTGTSYQEHKRLH